MPNDVNNPPFKTRKEGFGGSHSTKSIEYRRQVVIDGIVRWMDALQDGYAEGQRLQYSRREGDEVLICVRYGNAEIELNSEGNTVGVIDAQTDQIAFWKSMIKAINAGVYDRGIHKAAEAYSRRTKARRTD